MRKNTPFLQKDPSLAEKLVPYDFRTGKILGKYVLEELMSEEKKNIILTNYNHHLAKDLKAESISLQGYCTGGTLATIYASLHPHKVRNLVATAPVIDGWKDTTVVSNVTKHIDVDKIVDTIGNMPPEFMYYCFSILKPFEQGLEKYYKFFKITSGV